jgi:hypothetical protein
MKKIRTLQMVLAAVAVMLFTPAVLPSNEPMCGPSACGTACPENTYDCTDEWCNASFENWSTCWILRMEGYGILVCCQQ